LCQSRFFAKWLLGFCYICSWAGLVRTDSMSARAGDLIHNPELTTGLLDDEGDGASISKDEEIEWILEIYSPMISEKFLIAYHNQDYYEMRRLTYWTLQNNFTNHWNETVTLGFDLPAGNPVASLKHNPNAKYGGVRVYYTINKYVNNKYVGIMARNESLYFVPKTKSKYFDAYFPVDVKLYEGEGKLPTGNTYYKNDDFIGIFGESSLIIGKGRGSGIMSGYMRGFGYCEYYYTMKGYGLNISLVSSGIITGKYQKVVDFKTGKFPKPDDLGGRGDEIVIGAANVGATNWNSYSEDNTVSFKGISIGLVAGYNGTEKFIDELLKMILNSSGGKLNTCTDLLFPLPKNNAAKNDIKTGFNNCCCKFEIKELCK